MRLGAKPADVMQSGVGNFPRRRWPFEPERTTGEAAIAGDEELAVVLGNTSPTERSRASTSASDERGCFFLMAASNDFGVMTLGSMTGGRRQAHFAGGRRLGGRVRRRDMAAKELSDGSQSLARWNTG